MPAIVMAVDKITIQYSSPKDYILLSNINMEQEQNYQQTLQN